VRSLADIDTNVEHVSSFGDVRDRIHTEFATSAGFLQKDSAGIKNGA
jgi:hypothetical protein